MINNPALGPYAGMTGAQFFSGLIPALLGALLVIGVVVFVFMLLWGGIEWITAGGDKGKLEGAKQRLTNALIGIVVVLGFFAILSLVECFFGLGLRAIAIGPFSISLSGSAVCK